MSCDAALLEDARAELGMTLRDLWLDYFALGGDAAESEVDAYLDGRKSPSDHDYDLLAVALNEVYFDRGHDHPIPYSTQD